MGSLVIEEEKTYQQTINESSGAKIFFMMEKSCEKKKKLHQRTFPDRDKAYKIKRRKKKKLKRATRLSSMKWCTDGMSIDPLPRKAEEGSVLGSLPVRLDNSENSNAPKNDRVDDN